ncbi:MAG: MotA/TolQ/ExbB proton channel family protein [Acidiferrobacterales bacterium]
MKSVLVRDDTRRPKESTVVERPTGTFKDRAPADLTEDNSAASLSAPATADAVEPTPSVAQRVAQLFFDPARAADQDPYRYVLVLRFVLLNLVAFALLGAAYMQGLVDIVIAADRTYLSVLIFLVFLVGLGISARKVWQTSAELNHAREFKTGPGSVVAEDLARQVGQDLENRPKVSGGVRLKLSHRIAIVRHIANSLVLLGLIGTVLGFIIALSGVDPENATDISSISPMVSTLISGMSTALYTTLVGAVLNVWLMANHQLLAGGTVKLIAALIDLSEENARD